ncbi:ATP-dependent DNA ligase [Glaciihabitans arcticus]|uniref:ATP-dependent DNA ligase n=1 Tax=Glaciihabitans arcticus TaxID=2668039 RepID=A0A4V2JF30_9MICO|nr:ATP-dependent DNA ligase [Glaciihabitans arcticus]TBN57899.1 ATP-dependent DNA ligase [Glaciihabitans arcticus]
MGTLSYGDGQVAEFDDRALAHLQIVIGAKLRRGECFYFSWVEEGRVSDTRTSLWMNPMIPLVYKFSGSRPPTINRRWIDDLALAANTMSGLRLVPEPANHGNGDHD